MYLETQRKEFVNYLLKYFICFKDLAHMENNEINLLPIDALGIRFCSNAGKSSVILYKRKTVLLVIVTIHLLHSE